MTNDSRASPGSRDGRRGNAHDIRAVYRQLARQLRGLAAYALDLTIEMPK
jgi:hypothetical protein